MRTDIDWIDRAGARPKGFRPDYTGDFATERLMSITLALMAELSVTRERLDTVERLLADEGVLAPGAIDRFVPEPQAAAERGEMTEAYVARVLRGMQQAMERIRDFDAPIEDVVAELSRAN